MRPRKRVQNIAIKATLRPSQKIRNDIKIKVVLAQVFAYQESERVVQFAGAKHAPGSRQLRHVHKSDGGPAARILGEAVLETSPGIANTVSSGPCTHRIFLNPSFHLLTDP